MTIVIEDPDGQEVASTKYTPTNNIGGNAGNAFKGISQQKFEFDITETGDYVIAFYADAAKNADFVLGTVNIQAKEFYTTGIKELPTVNSQPSTVYDLNGRRIKEGSLKPGIYIKGGRKVVIQ